jgi:membrane protein required for colicin V production
MNWLDIIIIIILIVSAIGGLSTGLIKSLFTLAGLIAGVVLAGHFYVSFSQLFGFVNNETGARIIAFIIIFLLVMIVATILGVIFTNLVSAVLLGWLNRLLGAVLGVIIGAIFIAAILAIIVKMAGPNSVITGSFIAQFLLDRFPVVLGLLPPGFDMIRRFFK